MNDEDKQNALPGYLQPLLKDTPYARTKLIAAWDLLAPETQIQVLESMEI